MRLAHRLSHYATIDYEALVLGENEIFKPQCQIGIRTDMPPEFMDRLTIPRNSTDITQAGSLFTLSGKLFYPICPLNALYVALLQNGIEWQYLPSTITLIPAKTACFSTSSVSHGWSSLNLIIVPFTVFGILVT